MSAELKMFQPSSSQGDACTYMWACAICDENETCQKDKEGHSRWLVAKRMERIDYKILVMSNKGGVGKSTVFHESGRQPGVERLRGGYLRHGYSRPQYPQNGRSRRRAPQDQYWWRNYSPSGLQHEKSPRCRFLLQNSDDPIIWRDAYKFEFINQLLGGVEWQDLNFLIVDLPPGTGNESVTTIDLIGEVTGCVIISTPQEVALLDARKSVTFARDSELPIIGIVENMSGLDCPHCHQHIEVFRLGGGEASAHDMNVPFLGRISARSRSGAAKRLR